MLLVVVDEYEGFPLLDGIAEQAARLARQLIGCGVRPANIMILASKAARGVLPDGCTWLGRPNHRGIRKSIRRIANQSAELLWVQWIGHGVYADHQMKLLTADAEEGYVSVVPVAELWGKLELGGTQPRQIFTIDACQQNYAKVEDLPLGDVGERRSGNARQFILRGSRPGDAAPRTAGGGLFTEALMASIDELSEAGRWPPDITQLAETATQWLRDELGGDVGSTQWVTKAPWQVLEVDRTEQLHPNGVQMTPDTRQGLTAWGVPDDWRPGRYHPGLSSVSQVNLDVHLVADRGRAVVLVADPTGADLAADLNRAEDILVSLVGGDIEPRRWITVDTERHGDPLSIRDLNPWVLERADFRLDRQAGFVLRVDVADCGTDNRPRRSRLHAWAQRITQDHPDASIAVAVRSQHPADAILAARRLAPIPSSAGAAGPVLFTRARPGSSVTGSTSLTDLAGPPFVPVVLDWVQSAARQRRVDLPFRSTVASQGTTGRTSLSPTALAAALIEELQDPAFRWPVSVPDRDLDEVFLYSIRDFAPELFPELLQAYAARRTGPGWGVSLAVAAQFDQDIALWVSAAAEAGRHPDPRDRSEWPPALYRTAPADAVVLELARRELPPAPDQPWAADAWLPLSVSHDVAEAVGQLRRAPAPCWPAVQLSEATLDLVAALVAVVPDPANLLEAEPDCHAKQTWWAVRSTARSALGPWPMLQRLTAGPEAGFARAVLGLEVLEAEPLLVQEADELHHLLHSVFGR